MDKNNFLNEFNIKIKEMSDSELIMYIEKLSDELKTRNKPSGKKPDINTNNIINIMKELINSGTK